MLISRVLGTVFIVAGTAIGGGMLALPIVSTHIGYHSLLILMSVTWIVMCFSALLTLKINLYIKPGATFLQMTDNTLGKIGGYISNLSFFFLFYALIAAYIGGFASFLSEFLAAKFSHPILCLISTAIIGFILILGIKIVDLINKIFFIIMIAAFIVIIGYLTNSTSAMPTETFNYSTSYIEAIAVLPVFFTSFGFHGCTTPLIGYLGKREKILRYVFFIGSFIPLVIYLIWVKLSLGVLGADHLNKLHQNGSLSMLLDMLSALTGSGKWFRTAINLFSGFAIITSFIGVSLGLFDYIRFIINRNIEKNANKKKQNSAVSTNKILLSTITGIVTFVPPLICATFFPKIFIMALGFAAIPLAFISTLLPIAMMISLKKRGINFNWQAVYLLCGVFAVFVILIQLGIVFGFLPSIG